LTPERAIAVLLLGLILFCIGLMLTIAERDRRLLAPKF
jgi:hypothetical protein